MPARQHRRHGLARAIDAARGLKPLDEASAGER